MINSIDLAHAMTAKEPARTESHSDFDQVLSEARERGETDAGRTDEAKPVQRQEDETTPDDDAAVTAEDEGAEVATVTVDADETLVDVPVATTDVARGAQLSAEATGVTTAGMTAADDGWVASQEAQNGPTTATPGVMTTTQTAEAAEVEAGPVPTDPKLAAAAQKAATATKEVVPEKVAADPARTALDPKAEAAKLQVTPARVSEGASAGAATASSEAPVGDYFQAASSVTTARGESAKGDTPSFHLLDGDAAKAVAATNLGGGGAANGESSSDRGSTPFEAAATRVARAESVSTAAPDPQPTSTSTNSSTANSQPTVGGMTRMDARATDFAPRVTPTDSTFRADPNEEGLLARKVQRALRGALRRGDNHIRLRLDPPQLGRIDIDVKSTPDSLGVQLEVESEEIRNALLKHVSELEEILSTYGSGGSEVNIDLRNSSEFEQGSENGRGGAGETAGNEDSVEESISVMQTERHLGQTLDLVQ